jgi:hypothetical protein
MSGDNTAAGTVWGVAVESGCTHLVGVVRVEGGWTVNGWCSRDGTGDPVKATTPRGIVLQWALRQGWPVVELIAPGDASPAALEQEAEGAREEAACAWDKLNEVRTRLELERDEALAECERRAVALRVVALWLGGAHHSSQPDDVAALARASGAERDALIGDNAALRIELDDLRGRLSRTASRLADLERTSAALAYDATLAALRRAPVVSRCGACHEERARWCAGCGLCEATCCACTLGDEGSAA